MWMCKGIQRRHAWLSVAPWRGEDPSGGKRHTLFEDVRGEGPAALRGLRAQARQRAAQLRRDLLTGLLQPPPHRLLEEGDCCSHEGPGCLRPPSRAPPHTAPQKRVMTPWRGQKVLMMSGVDVWRYYCSLHADHDCAAGSSTFFACRGFHTRSQAETTSTSYTVLEVCFIMRLL